MWARGMLLRACCAVPTSLRGTQARAAHSAHAARSSSPPLRTLPLMRFRISSCQADTCPSFSLLRLTGAEGAACLPTLAGKVRSPGTVATAFRGVIHTLLDGPPGGHAGRVGEAFEENGLLDAAARGHSSLEPRFSVRRVSLRCLGQGGEPAQAVLLALCRPVGTAST